MFVTKFKYEPYPWLIKKGKQEEARASIRQVYFQQYADEKYEKALAASNAHKEAGATIFQLL